MSYDITEPEELTRKYIFKQKLAGKPITIPWSKDPWVTAMKKLDILIECGILEEGEGRPGRYWVRYPVMFHSTDSAANNEQWHKLPAGQRICEPGDIWEL